MVGEHGLHTKNRLKIEQLGEILENLEISIVNFNYIYKRLLLVAKNADNQLVNDQLARVSAKMKHDSQYLQEVKNALTSQNNV